MRLFKSQHGNVAMMFALLLVPFVMLAGIAVDYDRRETETRRLRDAVDTAVLAAARHKLTNGLATEAEIKAMALSFFNENYDPAFAPEFATPVIDVQDTSISFEITGEMPTAMMSIAGFETMGISANATAAFDTQSKLELALVLDNSGSMSGARIAALESAASSLLTTLVTDGDDSVKAAVVPFNNYVNIGVSHAGASWLDIPPNFSRDVNDCQVNLTAATAMGCTIQSVTDIIDGHIRVRNQWVCPNGNEVPRTCSVYSETSEWFGCVDSRVSSTVPPLNVADDDYVLNPIPARVTISSWGCPAEITPLTSDLTTLNAAITGMGAQSDTYIATGVTWGMRVLSSQAPFTEGADEATFAGEGGRKALVIMSDGANTRSASPIDGEHWNTDVAAANAKTLEACDEAKATGLEVYTIAFDVGDLTTELMLETCASSSSNFFDAADAAQLQDAFDNIGSQLKEIALSK